MPIIAKQGGGGDFQIAPEGQYPAYCVKVIDYGTQHWDYMGQPKAARQVVLGFELHGENQLGEGTAYMNGDESKPFVVREKFTASLSEKSRLRPFLEAWRGRPFTDDELAGFDVSSVLGATCMLTIQHSKSKDGQKTYANITTITPILKSLKDFMPAVVNKPVLFELDPFDHTVFEGLSDYDQETIRKSDEYKAISIDA